MISLKPIIFLFLAILIAHAIGTYNFWYWKFWWFDIPMHFFGGMLISMIFVYLVLPELEIKKHRHLITALLVISFAALISVFVEFYEFFNDIFFPPKWFHGSLIYWQLSLADTLKDIASGMLGSIFFYFIYLKNKISR